MARFAPRLLSALAACALLAGAPLPVTLRASVVRHAAAPCQAVAFTFDLCPVLHGSGFDRPLVQFLIDHQVPATFFASGAWMAAHEGPLRELLAVPFFEIGTHGEAHKALPTLSPGQLREEVLGPVLRLDHDFHRHAVLFRPPYGAFTPETAHAVEALGQRFVLWSVVSGDPDKALSADHIVQVVTEQTRPGGIIVFHANGHGWHTAEVVPRVYDALVTHRGLRAVTVSDLMADCAPHAAAPLHR